MHKEVAESLRTRYKFASKHAKQTWGLETQLLGKERMDSREKQPWAAVRDISLVKERNRTEKCRHYRRS